MPPQLLAPLELVYVSGVAEILGGLGLILQLAVSPQGANRFDGGRRKLRSPVRMERRICHQAAVAKRVRHPFEDVAREVRLAPSSVAERLAADHPRIRRDADTELQPSWPWRGGARIE